MGHLSDIKESKERLLSIFAAVVLTISAASFFLLHGNDPGRCQVLLKDGFWLNPSQLLNWQPAGCMLHSYRPAEAATCLAGRRVVFVGGTNMNALFHGVAAKLDPKYVIPESGKEHNDAKRVSDVRLEYIWDPKLASRDMKLIMNGFEDERSRPALTVIGLSYEQLKKQQDLTTWAAHLGATLSQLRNDDYGRSVQSDEFIVVPLFEPNITQLSAVDKVLVTPERVNSINTALADIADRYELNVAFAFNKVLAVRGAMTDGLTPSPEVNSVLADIVLNSRCNSELPQHYPFANTCCNHYPRLSWVQVAAFGFVLAFLPTAWLLSSGGHSASSSALLRYAPAPKYHRPLLILGGTVFFCWVCDRTNLFGKEQKQTSPLQFFVIMAAITAASMHTLKTSDKDLAFLNRDQTDEWKGWMQVVILVYHYVGVSKTQYIYNYVRVAVASYLWMTGFGHTVYFLKKDDFSFKRFVATMLRLNLLNVLLAYAMGNDWLLYYFAPLVTWNFFVLYAILWAGHKYNGNVFFVLAKMLVGALLNAAFCQVPGVLESCWGLLEMLFRMQGDMKDWRFRVTLDQYSIFPGMIAGILFINWSKYSFPKSAWWPTVEKALVVLSAVTMVAYAVFEALQPTKESYNRLHPFISWLPCCAFVVLRNGTPHLRRTHNAFFAWIGRCSLETFLLQFHIWLAADTVGLLTIGPTHLRGLNALVTTVLFLWIANHATNATPAVTEWIMGTEPKQLPTTKTTQAIPPGVNGLEGPPAHRRTGSKLGNANSASNGNKNPGADHADVEKTGATNSTSTPNSSAWYGWVSKDLRIRVAFILGAMALLNWTYYF